MGTRMSSTTVVLVAIMATISAFLSVPAAAAPGDGITEYALPAGSGGLVAIVAGPDGNMWFTESGARREGLGPGETGAGKIGKITPTGTITEYPLSIPYTILGGITNGPDGNLWFTETFYPPFGGSPPALGGAIGRITPTGTVTEFPLPKGGASPRGITAGPDGHLWFTITGYGTTAIGRITTDGEITQFPAYPQDSPYGIAAGPDGNLWFAMYGKIGRITTDATITEFPLPSYEGPYGIAAGPDGNLWFTEDFRGRIGRITPTGVATQFSPLAVGYLAGIAAGPDGNVWFTAWGSGGRIGRITSTGTVTEFKLPTFDYLSSLGGIAAGPDGNMWFTAGNRIGRISPAATPLDRWTCPITVKLHKPAPSTVGKRILTDKISTGFYCLLPKPVVRCRALVGATVSKKALCETKITKRGSIRVNAKRHVTVRVTVTVRAKPKPKTKAWFPDTWKPGSWRKSWLLR